MKSRTEEEIKRVLKHYEDEVVTFREIATKLCECALIPDFFDYLHLLPENSIDWLQDTAERAWGHPQDVDIFYLVHPRLSPEQVLKNHIREFWSAKILREYFFPEKPLPEFEVVKDIGVVSEADFIDGDVILFGDIEEYYIKGNPLICVRPDGSEIRVSYKGWGSFARNHTTDREYGIGLGPEVTDKDDIPPGTKVFVDRELVKEIPPKPEYKFY